MTIGARVLKTGLAVALAIYLSDLFTFITPVVAAVASIFAIQPSVQRSYKEMINQVQANLIGAAIALLALHLFGHTPIAVGLVVILVILINIRMRMESTIGLTLITVVVVMESSSADIMSALTRIWMVTTGMVSAFAVNVLVFPPRPQKQYYVQINEASSQLSVLLRTAVSNEMKEQVYNAEKAKLSRLLRKLEDRYNTLADERPLRASVRPQRARQQLLAKQLIKTTRKGVDLLDVIEEHYFAACGTSGIAEAQGWANCLDAEIEELTKYHEQILLKMAGKMKSHISIEPQEETEHKLFSTLAESFHHESEDHKRMIFVTSSLFEYSYHLRRLERIVDQVNNRLEGTASKSTEQQE